MTECVVANKILYCIVYYITHSYEQGNKLIQLDQFSIAAKWSAINEHRPCSWIEPMKKVNKQCLLDTPRTVRISDKNLASYSSNQQT